MPPMGAAVGGDEGAEDVMHHVLSLSGRTHDSLRAHFGKAKFQQVCAACHGADGKGNQQMGAPNLTDDIWLHGSGRPAIVQQIMKGSTSQMPAHKEILSRAKIHILAGSVYSLSRGGEPPGK